MKSINDPDPALSEVECDARLAIDRSDFTAMLEKADHRWLQRDHRAAAAYYAAAMRIGQQRSDVASETLNRVARMSTELNRLFRDHIITTLAQAGFSARDWHPRFRRSLEIMQGQRSRDPVSHAFPQLPTSLYYDGLPHLEFADPTAFDWRAAVEERTGPIREEALRLIVTDGTFGPYVRKSTNRPQGDVHGLLDNDDWSTFDLTERGHPLAQRVAHCPETHSAITATGALCDISNRAPTIMFSLLKAGKRIAPHTGMINARLICHLPLIVPGPGCLRVGSKAKQWIEGELLIFDDSVEHEAWNDAAADRMVLIFDIWRPELEPVERAQIRALFEAVDTY
jgi:aspartyl/asparaginyl beta-hydroxylase (cupin superfamily)